MSISIIIPVLNEQANIPHIVNAIRQKNDPRILEVIVVDGGSADSTVLFAKQAGAIVLQSDFGCRAAQMNLGAKNSRGDILYFIHADIKLPTSFVDDIMESLKSGFVAGCFRYKFESEKMLLRINSFATRFNGIFSGGGDQTLFIKRDLFYQSGGFNERYIIMEDFEFTRRIRKNNKFRLIPSQLLVSDRKYHRNSWLRVQLANLIVFSMFFLKFNPQQMKNTYNRLLNT